MNTKGILLAIVLAFLFNLASAQDFEGKIETVMTYVDEEGLAKTDILMEYTIKGERTKIKTDLPDGEMLMLFDYKEKSAKMASNGIIINLGDEHFRPKPDQQYEMKFTKKTKKILGYICKKVIVYKENSFVQEVWYTKSLAKMKEDELPYIDGFVMEYNTLIKNSEVKNLVTSIKKQAIQNQEFEPPEGYIYVKKEDIMKNLIKN